MKYFSVYKEELRGSAMSGEVYADGEFLGESDEQEIRTLTTGFSVYEYDEDGNRIGTEFYPVDTNMGDWSDNAEEVLEQIKEDYPADEWQNANW